MPLTSPQRQDRSHSEAGFSIVEVVVSALLLLVSTVAILSVFDYSIFSLRRSSDRDAIAAAISADLASIERMNDRYSCSNSTGACSDDDSKPNPTKYNYAPGRKDAGWLNFKQLCDTPTTTGSSGLSTALIEKINQTAAITVTTNGLPITISRSAKPHPDNNKADGLPNGTTIVYPRHLYIVEWLPPQGPKRELVLTPTVTNWCP
jgi:type II secretory pathway pseudopilin PulG